MRLFFISDKTAYFKWLQTSKELKGKGASGKRNSRSRWDEDWDPQSDQHRPLLRRWEQRNLGRTKECLMYNLTIASLLRLGSLQIFHNFRPGCSTSSDVWNQGRKMFGMLYLYKGERKLCKSRSEKHHSTGLTIP